MIHFIIVVLSLLSTVVYADDSQSIKFINPNQTKDDLYFKYGIGLFLPDAKNPVETKYFSFGKQMSLGDSWTQQIEGGIIADSRKDLGHNNTGLVGWSAGITPSWGPLTAQALWGASFITTPDTMLGGHFQFTHDLGIGIKDEKSNSRLLVNYRHLSNAGLVRPNKGRDFLLFQMSLPF